MPKEKPLQEKLAEADAAVERRRSRKGLLREAVSIGMRDMQDTLCRRFTDVTAVGIARAVSAEAKKILELEEIDHQRSSRQGASTDGTQDHGATLKRLAEEWAKKILT